MEKDFLEKVEQAFSGSYVIDGSYESVSFYDIISNLNNNELEYIKLNLQYIINLDEIFKKYCKY